MDEKKLSPKESIPFSGKDKPKTTSKKFSKDKSFGKADDQDVLLNLPAGFKYKVPGRRQRVLIGSIVIGLNLLLVISVLLYFYNPAFQDFVYNVGRN